MGRATGCSAHQEIKVPPLGVRVPPVASTFSPPAESNIADACEAASAEVELHLPLLLLILLLFLLLLLLLLLHAWKGAV